ncbi:hypothetical protein L208DRAFT_1388530 [Tricholoma matsutake]|nr:hypothetical protein L208DRAFT_1388530 [Tricholoma matsutake 945]
MFENKLHLFLQVITTPQTFAIHSLDDHSNTLDIKFSSNTQHLTFGADQHFSGQLASSVGSNKSCYRKPLSCVFPSFDSFLYQPDISQSGFSPLIALQVTTAATHDISIMGLEKVQKSLKPKIADLKNLRPTKARKMIILLVVPDTIGAAFVTQKIMNAKKMGHWIRRLLMIVTIVIVETQLPVVIVPHPMSGVGHLSLCCTHPLLSCNDWAYTIISGAQSIDSSRRYGCKPSRQQTLVHRPSHNHNSRLTLEYTLLGLRRPEFVI